MTDLKQRQSVLIEAIQTWQDGAGKGVPELDWKAIFELLEPVTNLTRKKGELESWRELWKSMTEPLIRSPDDVSSATVSGSTPVKTSPEKGSLTTKVGSQSKEKKRKCKHDDSAAADLAGLSIFPCKIYRDLESKRNTKYVGVLIRKDDSEAMNELRRRRKDALPVDHNHDSLVGLLYHPSYQTMCTPIESTGRNRHALSSRASALNRLTVTTMLKTGTF
jgi:hypothetical protein